jgi:hypothetical protein
MMTKADAEQKICPFLQKNCITGKCMFWEWEIPWSDKEERGECILRELRFCFDDDDY